MSSLHSKCYPIPVIIKKFTASAHISYYAHITPSYPISPIRREPGTYLNKMK